MKVALVGMMQSGKSTIVSAISGKEIGPVGSTSVGEVIVAVPDERLDWLGEVHKTKKAVYATVDCLDLPGLSFADEHTRGAARRLFGQVRTVDMFVIVVRGFGEKTKPVKDLVELQTEFLLADLELVTTRIERLEKQIHKPTKTQAHDKAELVLQLKLQEALEAERPLSSVVKDGAELDLVKSLGFLTLKPIMVVVNVGEEGLGCEFDFTDATGGDVEVVTLCATLERELAQLDAESRKEFIADMGLSFLTIGKDEVRAWEIREGTIAHDAAGKVHSDIKRGFIRAETIAFSDLKELGDEKAVKAAGKVRLEGKEYVVQDGDVIKFRFNV